MNVQTLQAASPKSTSSPSMKKNTTVPTVKMSVVRRPRSRGFGAVVSENQQSSLGEGMK